MRKSDSISPAGNSLGSFYLNRLERLVRLRVDFEEHLNPLGVELMDRSISTTYRDCADNGRADEARALIVRLEGAAGL